MAYYETINLVQGDTKPRINFTLKDSAKAISGKTLDENDSSTWELIDLSGHSIELKFRAINSTTILNTVNLTITDPGTNGHCSMIWPDESLDVAAGIYEGELQLTDENGKVHTVYDKLKFKVREQF